MCQFVSATLVGRAFSFAILSGYAKLKMGQKKRSSLVSRLSVWCQENSLLAGAVPLLGSRQQPFQGGRACLRLRLALSRWHKTKVILKWKGFGFFPKESPQKVDGDIWLIPLKEDVSLAEAEIDKVALSPVLSSRVCFSIQAESRRALVREC